MAVNIFKVGTSNAFSTTLNGTITDVATTITLTTVTGLQSPGVLVIDRVDSNAVATPVTREYISYTGITGSQLTGVSRGLGGSTAQAHNSGSVVEETWSVSHWNDFVDTFAVSHDSAGKIVSTSTATLSDIRLLTGMNASGASLTMSDVFVNRILSVSGASLTGNFPITPVWVIGGAVSLATTAVGKPMAMPQNGVWDFFSISLRQMVSGASFSIDINKNGTSILGANTLFLNGGGTYASTASIGTKTFVAGDHITVDIDNGGGSSLDLTVMGRAR